MRIERYLEISKLKDSKNYALTSKLKGIKLIKFIETFTQYFLFSFFQSVK